MEHAINPAELRQLLQHILRGTPLRPPIPAGALVRCESTVVARRAADGALFLRCYRSAHGTAAVYAELQAQLRALVGPPGPCTTCAGSGWLSATGAGREAAAAGLAFGAYRGVRFEPERDGAALMQAPGIVNLLSGGGGCGHTTRGQQTGTGTGDSSLRDDILHRQR
jgi:hypothetical protein